MLLYLLKFSACLAIFMLFYKLFLERENMHHVKRWFLLLSLLISLSIPLVTFTTYIEPAVVEFVSLPTQDFESFSEVPETPLETINYWPIVLWSIYILGVLLFGIKFMLNLYQIFHKIKRNTKQNHFQFIHVLLNDLIIPHTFFKFIFLNKHKYENKEIPREVFWHEQAHAKQKHSVDVLFLELLQIVFWFNPLIYLMRYNIKLNHEFLADQAVLAQGVESSSYQQILLEFTSNSIDTQLANAINYSSIKKRFTVMKTHTSKQTMWLKIILILPLVAMTLYGFSQKREITKESQPKVDTLDTPSSVAQTGDPQKDNYYQNVTVEFIDKNNKIISSKKYSDLTDEEKLRLPNQPNSPILKRPTQTDIDKWKDSKVYGVWIDESRIENYTLNDVKPSDFSLYYVSKLEKNAVNYGKHYYQVSLYSNKKYETLYQNGLQPLSEGAILRITDDSQVHNATAEEIAEYNKMAKHINTQNPNETILKQKDVERMEYLYRKMSANQKNSAEPYPDFSNFPPPPAPATGFINVNGETLFVIYYSPKRYYNKKGYLVDKNGTPINGNIQVNASDVLPGQYITKVYQNDKVMVEFKNNKPEMASKNLNIPSPPVPAQKKQNPPTQEEIDAYNTWAKKIDSESTHYISGNGKLLGTLLPIINEQDLKFFEIYNRMSLQQKNQSVEFPFAKENEQNFPLVTPPPTPPAPVAPLDHVIEMAKQGALFYNEGKKITSDEAIKLLTENKELNVLTKGGESKEPKIFISKEPIKVVPQNNSDEPILINGKKVTDNTISMTKEELAKATLSTKDGDIASFMFKIPGIKTESIKGNKLNDIAISNLEKAQIGDAIQLFMIKDAKNVVHPPVLITIKKVK